MNKNALLAVLLLCFCHAYGQDFSGCIEINFEDIPGEIPQEGLIIDDQFFFFGGITFSLEDGTSPVLAQTGGAATAFGSQWGNDEPQPGSGIGSFFLTDNGNLFGLQMIPVIVSFDEPIDSFSTCVLDIDFDEYFVMEARDEDGVVLLADTIVAGDPNTGDGVASCWGFNFDGCEGTVYSVRFEGFREQAGAFGLGMDRFSFCFAGVDIANEVVIQTDDASCDEETGAINILNFGDENLLYSLDGINYQPNPLFDDLPLGAYTVFIQDEQGCEAEFLEVEINDFIPLVIDDVAAFATSCGEDNGLISVLTTPDEGVRYSIDGVDFQSQNVFDDVPAGTYPVYIIDADNCLYSDEITVDPSSAPVFTGITEIIDNCNSGAGQIIVNGTGGTGNLTFLLNDQFLSTSGQYDSLSVGDYTIEMTDEAGCSVDSVATVLGGPLLLIEDLRTDPPTCENTSGAIILTASGGTGQLIYRRDGSNVSLDGVYNSLLAGTYQFTVTDGADCVVAAEASLPVPVCPVFIPSAFSPNDDGLNDEFVLFTNSNYDVNILKCDVFDRWGELVWRSEDFTLHTFRGWWDGNFRGQPATQGVYVYVAEVAYSNGQVEILAGDVALVR